MTKAIVFPVRTGKDWCEPEPQLVIERDSKTTAIKALRKAGIRVVMLSHAPYTSNYEIAAPVVDIISAAAAIKQVK